MLVEKEVISPGSYWYTDEATGLPRRLDVTPELTRYWHEQGSAMLSAGLTVPVPYEHDFNAHPMTPKDKLLNNAGEVKEYRLKGDALWSVVDVQDPAVKDKIGHSIRWTSPWINSFTDGSGKQWNNVISHLALTTRPRITKQAPFGSVAAALSLATGTVASQFATAPIAFKGGFCLSRAGRLARRKTDKRLVPRYPMAFSMWAGGVRLGDGDFPEPEKGGKKPKDKKKPKPPGDTGAAPLDDEPTDDLLGDDIGGEPGLEEPDGAPLTPPPAPTAPIGAMDAVGGSVPGGIGGNTSPGGLMDPLADSGSDIAMEELLCDLLQALGVPMPDESNENEFKRHLYEAAMSKIKELTSKGMGANDPSKMNQPPDQNKPPNQQPNASQPNPIIQQEQQPMYMSLDDINKLPDPMKGVALAMYAENQKLRGELDANTKTTASLRDAKLKEEDAKRRGRIAILSKLSPRVKSDLEAMVATPSMALSMGDGGAVVDPMALTLAVLEKGLADIPRLLTLEQSALSVIPHPTDASEMTDAQTDELADSLARSMGCPPVKKAG